jgi:hypothetical protein
MHKQSENDIKQIPDPVIKRHLSAMSGAFVVPKPHFGTA